MPPETSPTSPGPVGSAKSGGVKGNPRLPVARPRPTLTRQGITSETGSDVRAAIYTVLAGVVTLVFVGAVIFGSGRGLTRHERASVPHLSPSAIATDDRTE
jgi:hypothetical protein